MKSKLLSSGAATPTARFLLCSVAIVALMVRNFAHVNRWNQDNDIASFSLAATIIVDGSASSILSTSSTRNRNYLLNYTDIDENTLWNAMISDANASNYTCGSGSINGSIPTSINATLSANDTIVSISKHHHRLSYVTLDIAFRAYNKNSRPQTFGGDVFVVDYQSYWSKKNVSILAKNYTVLRSATFSIDHLDGTYHATLFLPRVLVHQQYVSVSLRHYYTCHEGLKLPDQLIRNNGGNHHDLKFGPLPWQKAAEEVQSVLTNLLLDETNSFPNNNLPMCSDNLNKQDAIDSVVHGVWIEQSRAEPPLNMNMTLDAQWVPFRCTLDLQLQGQQPTTATPFRLGDSTMPQRQVEIGIPYVPYYPLNAYDYTNHHNNFTGMLQSQLSQYNNNQSSSNDYDTVLFGGGLHHIFHGHFNVPTTADIVIRTLCQVGLAFRGGIFLRGTNVIQQHLFHVVDQTTLNSRRINWELHSRLRKSEHRLADLCQSISEDDLSSFVCLADTNGNLIPNDEAIPILLQQFNYSWERNSSSDHKHLADWFRSITLEERSHRYGDRTVGWIDLEEFLLPRPEMYRDKIHDGADFFFGPHSQLLRVIEGYADKS